MGISWRGGKSADVRQKRSTALKQWKPLFDVPGVQFVNLQYGDVREEITDARNRFETEIHNWDDADPLTDIDSFAAQISALDLVISLGRHRDGHEHLRR